MGIHEELIKLSPEQTLAVAEAAIDYPGGAELGVGTALLFMVLAVRHLEKISKSEDG